MKKTDYERIDATITTKDNRTIHYNVLEMLVKTPEDETFTTEQEVIDAFYEIVDQETRDSWNYKEIKLEDSWNDRVITAYIYG